MAKKLPAKRDDLARENDVATLIRANRWTARDLATLRDRYGVSQEVLMADRKRILASWRQALAESPEDVRQETAKILEEARHLRLIATEIGKVDVAAKILSFEARILGIGQKTGPKPMTQPEDQVISSLSPEDHAKIIFESLETAIRLVDPEFARPILERCLISILPITFDEVQK